MNWKKEILNFWNSAAYFYDHYDFGHFFEEFQKVLLRKLATHGQSSFKDYLKYLGKYYDFSDLEQYAYESKHTRVKWDVEDIKQLIFYPRYEHFQKKHQYNLKYEVLKDLYKDLITWETKCKNTSEKVCLVDRCIHAVHNSGNLLKLDIEELRKKYEEQD